MPPSKRAEELMPPFGSLLGFNHAKYSFRLSLCHLTSSFLHFPSVIEVVDQSSVPCIELPFFLSGDRDRGLVSHTTYWLSIAHSIGAYPFNFFVLKTWFLGAYNQRNLLIRIPLFRSLHSRISRFLLPFKRIASESQGLLIHSHIC